MRCTIACQALTLRTLNIYGAMHGIEGDVALKDLLVGRRLRVTALGLVLPLCNRVRLNLHLLPEAHARAPTHPMRVKVGTELREAGYGRSC
jgi:hypothetical protein